MGFSIPNPIDDVVDTVTDVGGDVVDTVTDVGGDVVDTVTDVGGDVVDVVTDAGGAVLDTAQDLAGNPIVRGGLLGGLLAGPAGVLPGALFGGATSGGPQGIMGPGPTGTGCVVVPPDRPSFWDRILEAVRNVRAAALSTSDQALDNAQSSLDGFREYMDLYNEYTGAGLSFDGDIQQPYDQLRGIDFNRLSDVAEQCATVAGEFGQTMRQLDGDVGSHTGEWSGDAADAFLAHMHRFGTASQVIDTDLGNLAESTSESVSAAQRVIIEYVDALRGIDFSDFDSPEIISLLIRISRMEFTVGDLVSKLFDGIAALIGISMPSIGGGGGGFTLNPIEIGRRVVSAAVSAFGELVGGVLDAFGFGTAVNEFISWVAEKARHYLDASFKAPFETNLELFRSATETATNAVTESFEPMVSAAENVDTAAFDGLADPPVGEVDQPKPPPGEKPGEDDTGGGGDDNQDDNTGGGTPPNNDTGGGSPSTNTGGGSPGTSTGGGAPVGDLPGGGTPGQDTGGTPDTEPLPGEVEPPDGGGGGGGGGRPEGLPAGSGWLSDPSKVPPGWMMDPDTGELVPPEELTRPLPGQTDPSSQAPGAPVPDPFPPFPGGEGERPEGLPEGSGWIGDPSQLPQGWTVDPATGELFPPGDPGGGGFPEVHSPEGATALGGGDGAGGAGGGAGEIVIEDGDNQLVVSGPTADGDGISLSLTDGDGNVTEYEIRFDEHGQPELVPAESPSALDPEFRVEPPMGLEDFNELSAEEQQRLADQRFGGPSGGVSGGPDGGGFAGGGPGGGGFAGAGAPGGGFAGGGFSGGADLPAAGGPAGVGSPGGPVSAPGMEPASTSPAAEGFGGQGAGHVGGPGGQAAGGVPGFAAGSTAGGEVSGGGPAFPGSGAGQAAGGSVPPGGAMSSGGHVTDGSAHLASASESASGSTPPPGGAQLASAGDDMRPGQGSTSGGGTVGGGGGMMPMGAGAPGMNSGDEQRPAGGNWQVPGEAVFEPTEDGASRIRHALGEDDR